MRAKFFTVCQVLCINADETPFIVTVNLANPELEINNLVGFAA